MPRDRNVIRRLWKQIMVTAFLGVVATLVTMVLNPTLSWIGILTVGLNTASFVAVFFRLFVGDSRMFEMERELTCLRDVRGESLLSSTLLISQALLFLGLGLCVGNSQSFIVILYLLIACNVVWLALRSARNLLVIVRSSHDQSVCSDLRGLAFLTRELDIWVLNNVAFLFMLGVGLSALESAIERSIFAYALIALSSILDVNVTWRMYDDGDDDRRPTS